MNVPHRHWQDVFAGHVASHFLPGGGASWLAIAAVALAAYLLTVDRLAQRHR